MTLQKTTSIYASIILLLWCHWAQSQTGISFYNLGNSTFQNSFYNPSFIPEGKVFIGLPVLSGVHLHVNNKFDYTHGFVKTETGKNRVDLESITSMLQRSNTVSAAVDISLFHFAYTANNGVNFSIFANERIEADVLYTRQTMEFLVDGNASLLGEKVKLDKTAASATYFREIGVGASGAIPRLKMNVGVRLKYLQGIVNANTTNYTARVTTDETDYHLDVDLQGAALQTSGYDILRGRTGDLATHLISNQNRGVSTDFGISMELNRYVNFSASIVDIGFISWKEDITNYTIPDTVMQYNGLDLRDPENLEENIKDSLINRFKKRMVRNHDPYSTFLNPKLYTSISYKTPVGGELVGSLGTRFIKGRFNYLIGAGYRHRFGKYFVGSANITRLPQHLMNLGASFAVKGGPAQFYMAVDQIWNFDLTKSRAIDVRLGMNFIFGKGKNRNSPFGQSGMKEPRHKASTHSFLGSKVKSKGSEGIYTLIKKQNRRTKKEYTDPGADIPNESTNYSGTTRSEAIPSTSDKKIFGGQSEPIPTENRKLRTGKSDPIPKSNKKVRGGKSDPIPGSKKQLRGGKSDPIPGGNRKLRTGKSDPIPRSKKKLRGGKSDPIPTTKTKKRGGKSAPIPNSKKKVRGGKSAPIPSGNKKVKTRKSSPIPKGKKKRRND